jgi:GntR family transcriptional regulator of arabinose operon
VAVERRVLNTLLEMDSLDGVLVEGTKTGFPNPNLDLYRKLMDRGIPLVFLHGNYPELKDTLWVLDDNYHGGEMLVDYLYKKGHRNIAGVFKSDDIQGHQRYAGYAAGLQKYGLPFDDSHILWYDTELKRRILEKFFEHDITRQIVDGCSAVVCYNDEIASHMITSLTQSGISVPKDIAVVSFDNSQYSEISVPRITSLSHGENNVGRMAARLLFRLIQGQPVQSQLAPWILIEKESS